MKRRYDYLQKFLNMRFDREGIARNVGFILIIGSLLVMAAVAFVLARNQQHRQEKWAESHGTALTALISRVAIPYFLQNRTQELQSVVQAIKDQTLAYCIIVDVDNRIVAHTNEKRRGQPFESQVLGAQTALGLTKSMYEDPQDRQTLWHFSIPINSTTRRLGTLYIGIKATGSPGLGAGLEDFSLVALLIFLIVPLVYYCLRGWLAPLRKLGREISEMAARNQLQPLQVGSGGEIGELQRNWNQVISHFKDGYETVKTTNFELELTVSVLAYEKRRLAMILNRLPDAILITDSSGRVTFANKITERFLNFAMDEIIGSPLKECFSDDTMTAFLKDNEEVLQAMSVRSIEVSSDVYNTEIFKVTYSSLIDEEENIVGGFLLIRNITQQKLAEQSRSEFVSAVSHEIKNPLTTIKSYVELLINELVDDNETKYEFYNTINDETDRMVRLIDNLLNLSRIELGSLQIKSGRVRMKQLLADCFQAVESQAIAKNIKFELQLPDKFPTLEGDKDLLGTIIMNLLSNALKYTPAGGEVNLFAEETEDEVLIHVRDTGIGIPETDLAHIFERFYRAQNGEKVQSGSGLGLALAQQIAQLHGGTISVSSQINRGSQFTVILPNTEKGTQLIGAGRYSREDSDH